MKTMLNEVREYVLPIFGAVIGSALRITQRLNVDGVRMTRIGWIYELVLSVSIMFGSILFCDYYQLDSKLSAGIGFVSSYTGIAVINALKSALLGKITKEKEENHDNEQQG